MRTLKRAAAAALLALLAGLGGPAGAHNFHMGIADISFNAKTGSTEIVHTYTAHDIEALLAERYQRRVDLGLAGNEDLLKRYVDQQFWLQAPKGGKLRLRWVGMKADADSVVIFQEIEATRLAPATRIHNQLLIDFIPGQRNNVNVQSGERIDTLLFDKDHGDLPTR